VKYGMTTVKDHDANRLRMAANWHRADGFDALMLRLFTGTAYTNACRYPIANRDVIDISIRVIKRSGLYAEEYKQWITRGIANASATPPLNKTFETFKVFWSDKITLINLRAIPASSHSYGMMATTNDSMVGLYEESLANFGAAYTANQESVKMQGTTIASM
jgi:hypothetical protein